MTTARDDTSTLATTGSGTFAASLLPSTSVRRRSWIVTPLIPAALGGVRWTVWATFVLNFDAGMVQESPEISSQRIVATFPRRIPVYATMVKYECQYSSSASAAARKRSS